MNSKEQQRQTEKEAQKEKEIGRQTQREKGPERAARRPSARPSPRAEIETAGAGGEGTKEASERDGEGGRPQNHGEQMINEKTKQHQQRESVCVVFLYAL